MACNKFLPRSKLTFAYTLNQNYIHCNKANISQSIIKEAHLLKCHHYTSRCQFSTVLNSRQSWVKKYNLYKVTKTINSAAFLSTNIDSDKYHVVVTDPSQLNTGSADLSTGINNTSEIIHPVSFLETPSVVTDVSDLSTTTVTSNFSDIVASVSNEALNASELIEPSLASLGLANWTPVGLVQTLLESLHITWGMPWWLAIAATTVMARILLLPVLVKTQKNAINMSNHMPKLQFLQAKFGEARKCGNTMEASRYASEVMNFMKNNNISPVKNAMMPLIQAPVFLSFFLGLRGMAKVPVESMKCGGIGWATDLTIPDPYYVLPVVACGTLYIVLKIGAESGIKMENMKMAKYVLQALPVVALPFCINFPAAVVYYWVTTNFCTLAIVSVLKIKPVRRFLNMPTAQPIDPKFTLPKKGFVGGMKEAIEDQKALANIDDRRRMDEMRFLKAGTGPIPRTYSYDPTKPRPSNVAVSAKQHEP